MTVMGEMMVKPGSWDESFQNLQSELLSLVVLFGVGHQLARKRVAGVEAGRSATRDNWALTNLGVNAIYSDELSVFITNLEPP